MVDEVTFDIQGESMQFVDIALDPGETVIAEAGMMMYMTEGIDFATRFGDGSEAGLMGKLWGAAKRALTSEGLFLTTLEGTGRVWLQSLPFARLADRVLQNALHLKRDGEGCCAFVPAGSAGEHLQGCTDEARVIPSRSQRIDTRSDHHHVVCGDDGRVLSFVARCGVGVLG